MRRTPISMSAPLFLLVSTLGGLPAQAKPVVPAKPTTPAVPAEPAAAVGADTVVGDWREPGGSVLHVSECGEQICMSVVLLRPTEPLRLDIHDPDPARRSLPICNLRIGYGFHPEGPGSAKDGRIYDPESGHTYHAEMHTEGGKLHLRGYILFPALGRTEKWTRVTNFHEVCH